jgi:hypothetical protein
MLTAQILYVNKIGFFLHNIDCKTLNRMVKYLRDMELLMYSVCINLKTKIILSVLCVDLSSIALKMIVMGSSAYPIGMAICTVLVSQSWE